MKRTVTGFLAAALVISMCVPLLGRDSKKPIPRYYDAAVDNSVPDIPGYESRQGLYAAAAADTYCVVWYDFEYSDWQSWTQVDNTAQKGTFFHVDDFAGLNGGTVGRLVPIEGTKSLWCGVRGGDSEYTCSWGSAPGYGNKWNQICYSDRIEFTGMLTWSFKCVVDSEPTWDFTFIEYDAGDDNWVEITRYDGVDTLDVVEQLLLSQAATKLRFHFVSDGVWSDEDGLYDTDGAFIVDIITVADAGGVIDFEDFETYDVGDIDMRFWHALPVSEFGIFSGLSSGLQDLDPCNRNMSTVITFFHGSPWPSEDYPGLYVTPFHYIHGYYSGLLQDEMVVSPPIDLTRYSTGRDNVQDAAIPPGDLAGINMTGLRFSVYADMPSINRVIWIWKIRNFENGCPGPWLNEQLFYFSNKKTWILEDIDISALVTSDTIQVALGVADICPLCWLPVPPECEEHTPAPWYDHVRIYRTGSTGPSWRVRDIDLFQDTFPQEVSGSANPMEEFCRADMANDVATSDDYDRIDPGDSVVVTCAAPFAGGLDTLGTGEARVYLHCNVEFLGPDGKPDLFGPQLAGTYGSYVSDDGEWTVLLCEPAATSAGNLAPDKYCIDLNDSLFTRGYMVEYYFKAWDIQGSSSTYPESAEETAGDRFEFTCLPTLMVVPGVLFVDDYHGRGTFEGTVETYWNLFLDGIYDPHDRYDVNGPSSGVSNGIGAYVSAGDASSILCTAYEKILFDSGDLDRYTICEGTEQSDKGNDAQLLVDWMNVSEHKVGLLVMGDQVAFDLSQSSSAVALKLVSTICGVTLENSSYYEMTGGFEAGGVVNPLITGVSGGPFDGLSYYAYGGCPYINNFDVLERTGPGQYALQYPDYNSLQYYAGIFTDQLNDASEPLRTVWAGHSLMQMRSVNRLTYVRASFLSEVFWFFENAGWWTDAGGTPKATSLEQNFPNPFNPVTRLSFSLKQKGHVSMRIYDVAGRLVRVLLDEVRDAGSYEVVWDGTNNEGRRTASGVYFCRMEAGDYERTLKMVQLR